MQRGFEFSRCPVGQILTSRIFLPFRPYRQAQPFLGEPVEVGCVSILAPIVSQVAIPEVIREDDQEARLLGENRDRPKSREPTGDEEKEALPPRCGPGGCGLPVHGAGESLLARLPQHHSRL